jgi:DNA-binding MarR family transcriptional regulator
VPDESTTEQLHPGLLMFIAFRHLEQRVITAVMEDGYDITVAQARLAARVGEDGSRLTDLAEQAQITKQSAGFLVDQLERAGYVERVPDPRDARARLVRLGERGLGVQRRARKEEAVVLAEWERHLGPARLAALQDALNALREITDPYA